jgi:hypothetical protein
MILHKFKNIVAVFSLTALVLGTVFTVCHFVNIEMDGMEISQNTESHQTAFIGGLSCCHSTGMNHSLHVSTMNTLTHNINVEKNIPSLAMLFVLVVYALGLVKFKKPTVPAKYYINHWEHSLSNYIFKALSEGILQPKLYNA